MSKDIRKGKLLIHSPTRPGEAYLNWKMAGFPIEPGKRPMWAVMLPTTLVCKKCEKPFMTDRWRKFCLECSNKWYVPVVTEPRPCRLCSKLFTASSRRMYCHACLPPDATANHFSLEGRGLTRYLVRMRDKFTCLDCGVVRTQKEVDDHNAQKKSPQMKSLDVHHINGLCGKKTKGYDAHKDMKDLITLCHSCHFKRHDFSKEGKESMHKKKGGRIKQLTLRT